MRIVATAISVVLAVAYPLAVFWALTHLSARTVGLLGLCVIVPGMLWRFRKARREDLAAVVRVPLLVVALLAAGAVFDDQRFVLAMPVLISLALLVAFAGSLRAEATLVERFARAKEGELDEGQVRHCRQVTIAWVIFLALNAGVAAFLALAEMRTAWAVYTGGIAYGLMGLMFAGEYVIRQYRFRRYGRGLHDRLLSRVFPAPTGAER